MDQLFVKHAGQVFDYSNLTGYIPFDINMGIDEYLEIHKLKVHWQPSAVDASLNWGLIQKNMRLQNGVTELNRPNRRDDNDIIVAGFFVFVAAQQQGPRDEWVTFESPVLIPRSPTMEFRCDLVGTMSTQAHLYYKIKKSKDIVMKLMKQYYGRSQ